MEPTFVEKYVAPYWKAIVAFVAPAAVVFTSAVTSSSAGGEVITQGEVVTAVCAMFITAATVWAVPNEEPYEV